MRPLIYVAALSALMAAMVPTSAAAQASAVSTLEAQCRAMTQAVVDDVRIVSATWEQPGPGWAPTPAVDNQPVPLQGPERPFCRLQGVIEQEIEFELWLPSANDWNGRFLGAGVGGDAGRLNLADMRRGAGRGFASASTNTGHRASDVSWMLGPRERLANYTLRANHLLAERGKRLADAFYGRAPAYSYFVGCSGGGRQGLKEMQVFPGDYDGIVSGAGGPASAVMTARRMWELRERDLNPGLMSPGDWKLIADAGLASCDELDGLKDGVAQDARLCRFEIASLQCRDGAVTACLTPQQVAFAKRFYAPLIDQNGRKIDDGLLAGIPIDSGRSQLALGSFGRVIRGLESWDGADFHLATDLDALKAAMPDLSANQTDLREFRDRGGKVILWSGWMDPAVAGRMMTGYYDAVRAEMGDTTDDFMRLYMLPGVYHCARGPGADRFGGVSDDGAVFDENNDLLAAVVNWVEQGTAPGVLTAAKLDQAGQVEFARPICVYPEVALYDGRSPTHLATSFTCRTREEVEAVVEARRAEASSGGQSGPS